MICFHSSSSPSGTPARRLNERRRRWSPWFPLLSPGEVRWGAGPREGAYLRVPDVDTLVEGAAGQVAAVGAEGHAVDGLLVLGERVDADAALHVPQPHRRVERRAARGNAHVVHW